MANFLSSRATDLIRDLDLPWRWAPRGTYSPIDNPSGLVSFGTAENVLVHQDLEDFTKDYVTFPKSVFSYSYSTAGGPELPAVIAQHVNEYFQPSRLLDGSEIRVTGAATAMHEILGWAVGNPHDGILTSRPVYGRFELDFGNKAGLRMVYADTTAENSFDVDVVNAFEKALAESRAAGVQIRALLIVNPNNPVGRCYPKETLIEIMKFCQKNRLHLISDEIYATSVFSSDLPVFTSVLSIKPGFLNDELLHVIYGFSKDFGAAGLRLGCLITRSEPMLKLIQMTMRFHNPSGASVAIATAMLSNREWCTQFVSNTRHRIGEAYQHVTAGLRELGINYLPANAGFFVYVDLSPYLDQSAEDPEFNFSQKLLDAGVFLHPKEEHGRQGWYRIVYTQPPEVVDEGLRRIKTVLQRKA
ncbi:unnamed protein product [Clonostachys byssicola]|uniref:Aminotransferase class I/classII large domain-containing protein n=1 Tax=Clonostachys byssicola TaxID=160290 RepID=A0A9N9U114_9HYPO|nr:unnamed protein product [Clonostachys byssicola]